MAKAIAPYAGPVDVMVGWLGTKEIPGAKANPIIAGTPTSWFSLVGHPEITSDEVANCAVAVGAAEVVAALLAAGLTLEDVQAEADAAKAAGRPAKGALQMLADRGVHVALPPLDQRMLARSYCTWGVDASGDPRRGDVGVLPRGAKWQGHVVRIVSFNRQTGVAKCIGANQSDTTSYANHHISEFIDLGQGRRAIRRGVAPTIKDLRTAGSASVTRGDQQQTAGASLVVGGLATAATQVAVQSAAQPVPAPVVQPIVDTGLNLAPVSDGLGIVNSITSTGVSLGTVFLQNPWLVVVIGAGIGIWWLGRTGKIRRLAQHVAGVPLSSQTA